MHSPNYRVFKSGNITAKGSIDRSGATRYYSLEIGTLEYPLNEEQAFSIRARDGVVLKSSDFVYQTISSLAEQRKAVNGEDGVVNFFLSGFTFVFRDEKLVSFRASLIKLRDESYTPEIGNVEGKSFFSFPISESVLVDMFGEPDLREDAFKL
ncbi:MAG: hypothetical protein M5U15_04865 [Kiritimatiellae bacterium]|nr:hypothetical protein [Kiritimatiellia bacterium]